MRCLFAFCLAFTAALPAFAQPLLRPVPLVAGQSDTLVVADYFTDAESLAFGSVEGVTAQYDADAGTLVLTPAAGFEGLALVPFRQGRERLVLPVRSRILTPHRFTFEHDARLENVFVIGQFNDWSRSAHPLAERGDGVWETTVPLEPGRYEYKFTADGTETLDPDNAVSVPNGLGGFNNVLVVPPRHAAPLALLTLPATDEHLRFMLLSDGEEVPVAPEDVVALVGNARLGKEAIAVEGDEIHVRLAPEMDGQTVRVAVRRGGQATPFASVRLGEGFAWRDAVLYQIMVDRWADGDASNSIPVPHDSVAARANYHGGDLQGILDKLEAGYFDALGVNALWLSPVVQNTDRAEREYPPPHRFYTGYHGYWPTAPRAVEERFGDLALLRKLVDAAHARGMKVLLDFVANHVHEEHPYFQAHRDWFGTLDLPDGRKNLRLWDEQRLTTWFEPYLPSFDFLASDAALDAVTDDAVWWLRETGADGFRHDAVKHIPNRFWRTLTQKIRRAVDPGRTVPVYQIGETFGSYDLVSSYVTPAQLDAQFDFNLYEAAQYAFLDRAADFAVLDAEMHKSLGVYGTDHVMGTILDSHDKTRFLAFADGDITSGDDAQAIGWQTDLRVDDETSYRRAELYLAYLLTSPGVPTIYYGVEIGMTGAADPDNRRPMRFGDAVSEREQAHKDRVTDLVRLRRDHPALRRGGFHTLQAEGDVWAYLRDSAEGSVLVVLNKGEAAQRLTLDLPRAFGEARFLTDEALPALDGRTLTLDVPALGYRMLALD